MAHVTAVVVLLGVILMGAMLGIAVQRDTQNADLETAQYDFRLLARDAAMAGLQMTVYKLADSYPMGSWTTVTGIPSGTYRNGTFTSTVVANDPVLGGASGDTVDVVVRGANGPGRHVIFARYARDKDDKGIPPAFKHAIVSDEFMQIDGNMLIAAINDGLNASIHTNDDLTVKGNSFIVEGFGTYTGTVSLNGQSGDNFLPNVDYNGPDPNYHWSDSVNVPSIDVDRLKKTAGGDPGGCPPKGCSGTYIEMGGPLGPAYQVDGSGGWGGVIDFTDSNGAFWVDNGLAYTCTSGACGTEQNPFILFVNGPTDFLNTVQIVGNGIVMSTGNVTVAPTGSGGGVYGALNENQETKVILATTANITVGSNGGNACLGRGPSSYLANDNKSTWTNNHCQSPDGTFSDGLTLYAEEAIFFKGTPFIVGGVIAKLSEFKGGGNPWITYASANEGTFDAGFEWIVPIGPILIAFSEF